MKYRSVPHLFLVAVLALSVAVIACAVVPSVAYAKTPSDQITPGMFPTGSRVSIDYTPSLNVRSGPDNSYGVITTVSRGATFTVLEYDRKWVKIDTARGEGWVFAGYLQR